MKYIERKQSAMRCELFQTHQFSDYHPDRWYSTYVTWCRFVILLSYQASIPDAHSVTLDSRH